MAERGLAVALFGRAAAAAGIEVVAVRRAGGRHVPGELIVVCTRRGDGLGPGLAADGAGERAHARLVLGRLRGHGAAVPLVAERGLAVALFGRAAAAAGIEVVAVRRAGGRHVPGELIVVRTRRGDGLGPGLAADGAGERAHAGGGLGRLRGHFARVPLVRVCARGGDDLGLDLAADGAGVGAHAGGGLGRLGGHGAAVPLVAERGLAVALFGRAAAAAGIEVVAVRRAGGRHVPGELIVVRTRRGDGLGPGLAADGAGERAHAGGGLGRLRGHGAVVPGVRAGGGDLLGRDDITAVVTDGLGAAGLPAGGGHGVLVRAVARVQTCTLAADGVALPLAVIKRPAVDRVGVIVDGDDSGLEAMLGRAGGLDRRGRAVAAHVLQRGAAGERVVADARHGAGQLHVFQRGAALEAAVGNGGHAGGQRHIRQRGAAGEGGRAELGHRLGDGRSGERLAALKRALADGGHGAGVFDVQQLRAVGKALAGHGRDGGGQSGVRETGAGVKCAAAEALQPVRQRDGGQSVARETEVTDLGHTLGDGQARELGAHGDAVAADARHALGQRDLRGGRQEEQRVAAHVRDAVFDDDLFQLALQLEVAKAREHTQRFIVPPRGEVALGEVEVGHHSGAGDGQRLAAENTGGDLPVQAVVLTEVARGGRSRKAAENGIRVEIRDLKLLLELLDLLFDELLGDLLFQIVDFAGRCVHGQAGEQSHDQNETQCQREHALFHRFFLLCCDACVQP